MSRDLTLLMVFIVQAAGQGGATKRAKKEVDMSEIDFEAQYKAGTVGFALCSVPSAHILQLKKLTVPVLKAFLKQVGEKPEGKKADIINQVSARSQQHAHLNTDRDLLLGEDALSCCLT